MAEVTGPEHYREAEVLLKAALAPQGALNDTTREFAIAQAQVHATLALAAATAQVRRSGAAFVDYVAWPEDVIA